MKTPEFSQENKSIAEKSINNLKAMVVYWSAELYKSSDIDEQIKHASNNLEIKVNEAEKAYKELSELIKKKNK